MVKEWKVMFNDVVLYITLGFMLICFVAWLWQSIVKRRKLEDRIADQRDAQDAGDGTVDAGAQTDDTPHK